MSYPESAASAAASLRFQHRLFLREIGSLIPETVPLTNVRQTLDVFCGPGVWCLELASLYPDMQITGIDRDAALVRIAHRDARLAKQKLLRFEHYATLKKLPFNNGQFDFIHSYHSHVLIIPRIVPATLKELFRVLRPGGWINLVNFEIGPVSSPSAHTLFTYLNQAYSKAQKGSPSAGFPLASATLYPQLLMQAGYSDIHYNLYPVDIGNLRDHMGCDYVMSILANGRRIAAFLEDMEIASQQEVTDLLQATMRDAQNIDYFCAGVLISVVATKPLSTPN